MKFIARNARVAGAIEVTHEAVHERKKADFKRVVVAAVEPMDFIVSDKFIVILHQIVANSRRLQLFFGIQSEQIGFHTRRERDAQKVVGESNFIVNKTVNETIKNGLQ
jgi:hypothetical protein